MSSGLDMSLDDIIKSNKRSAASSGEFRGRGRGSATGTGPTRRIPNRSANRAAPYSLSKVQAPDSTWQHDMFMDQVAAFAPSAAMARPSAIETGTKLYISNLEYGVSNEDIKELFSEVGDLKRHSIHYDRSGRSKGTAEVVFSRRPDAFAALKRYNNVQLDGKPMKIEIVGTNIPTLPAPVVPFVPNVGFGNTNFFPRSGAARGGPPGWSRGGLRGRRGGGGRGGRGRGRGGGRGDPISPADLDADLDKYYKENAPQQKNN